MAFFPPVPLIRRVAIIRKLTNAKAFTKETAKALDEIGLINPYFFPKITEHLVKQGRISRTEDGKYYINR